MGYKTKWGNTRRLLALSAVGVAVAASLMAPEAPASAQTTGTPAAGATTAPREPSTSAGGPAAAPTATAPSPALTAALARAETARLNRRFQEMLTILAPYENSNNFDAYIAIGRAWEGLRLPENCMKALDWHNKAIALQPNNYIGYERRAAGYDCLGNPYFQPELNDRAKVVDLRDVPGSMASAGNVNDLAGATLDLASPSGQGQVDFARVQKALELRSKAIAMTPRGQVSTGGPGSADPQANLRDLAARLLDRAELINSRLINPGGARVDADTALDIAQSQLDMTVPANLYARAQAARRYAALGTTVGAALNQPGFGTFRPNQETLRNEALDYYTRYIDAFEASGRNFQRYGDAIDAYINRASTHNQRADAASKRKAIADYTTAFELNPNEPRRLWDRAQIQLGLRNNSAVRADILQYQSMTKGVDIQGVNGRQLDLLRQIPN